MKFFGKTAAALAALVIVPLAARADLRVATASTYPPYEFLNEKGELDGFDKDLMEEIGRRLGEKIVWLDTGHYDMVIPSLVTDRADVIAAGMSATPIRAKRVLFSTPYVPTMASFVTAPNVAVKKLEDLRGLRGCVPVGTTQDVFRTPLAGELGFQIKNFAKIEECLTSSPAAATSPSWTCPSPTRSSNCPASKARPCAVTPSSSPAPAKRWPSTSATPR